MLTKVKVSEKAEEVRMGPTSRGLESLLTAIHERIPHEAEPDVFARDDFRSLEEDLEQRRSELKNGLTDLQRLFLFGKLSGLNDKDAALAAGYSLSVAENTKQRIWKPQVCAEYERVKSPRLKTRP